MELLTCNYTDFYILVLLTALKCVIIAKLKKGVVFYLGRMSVQLLNNTKTFPLSFSGTSKTVT